MHEYSCEVCGKVKYAKYKSHMKKYCSHKCANVATSGIRTKAREVLICEYCNEEFELLSSVKKAREKLSGKSIKFCSKKCEGLSRTLHHEKKCLNCEKLFKPKNENSKYCSRKCTVEHFTKIGMRKRNGYWYENGYKVLYAGNGKGIKEHIKIMEDFIGRKLEADEVVHHINEDKLDNRIENLQLMTKSEHSKLHRELDLLRGKVLFNKNK